MVFSTLARVDLRGVTWRTLVSRVRLGGDEYRVVRPAQPPLHAPMYHTRIGGHMATAVDLACAWWLAARSRRSIVYLALRESLATCPPVVRGTAHRPPALDDRVRRSHNDFCDHLRWDVAARRFFLVGSEHR